jgi:hypothetical protein
MVSLHVLPVFLFFKTLESGSIVLEPPCHVTHRPSSWYDRHWCVCFPRHCVRIFPTATVQRADVGSLHHHELDDRTRTLPNTLRNGTKMTDELCGTNRPTNPSFSPPPSLPPTLTIERLSNTDPCSHRFPPLRQHQTIAGSALFVAGPMLYDTEDYGMRSFSHRRCRERTRDWRRPPMPLPGGPAPH